MEKGGTPPPLNGRIPFLKGSLKEQEPISLLTNSLLPLFVPLIVNMKQILTFMKLECSGDMHEIIKIHGQKLPFK